MDIDFIREKENGFQAQKGNFLLLKKSLMLKNSETWVSSKNECNTLIILPFCFMLILFFKFWHVYLLQSSNFFFMSYFLSLFFHFFFCWQFLFSDIGFQFQFSVTILAPRFEGRRGNEEDEGGDFHIISTLRRECHSSPEHVVHELWRRIQEVFRPLLFLPMLFWRRFNLKWITVIFAYQSTFSNAHWQR